VVSTLAARGADIARRPDPLVPDPLVEDVRRLGAITGGLHAALASDDRDADFRPEPVGRDDVAGWAGEIARELAAPVLGAQLTGDAAHMTDAVARALTMLDRLAGATAKIRVHGDYHLGQVLKTADGFVIIDFEGEPARPLAERRRKQPALRDLAGMLRSLDYAAHAVAFRRPEPERAAALVALTAWEAPARDAFLAGYLGEVRRSPTPLVPATAGALLSAVAPFELQKAAYELRYELDNRPDWVAIPLAGIRRILGRTPTSA
jgi:maltose alpha-D-glucosyltransferase/alpha-amylase